MRSGRCAAAGGGCLRCFGNSINALFFVSPEPDVFEIVLPITVLVLSDDDFLQDDAEERAASVPRWKEGGEREGDLNNSDFLKGNAIPSNGGDGVSIGEESKTAVDKDNSMKCSEEKRVAESVCNSSESSLSDQCDAGTDKCSQNYVLLTPLCKTELTEINETSDRKERDGDDGFQKIPPLSCTGNEGEDGTIETSGQLTSAAISKCEEELVSGAGVLSDEIQEEQPEIHKEMETIVKIEGKLLIRLVQEFKKSGKYLKLLK